MPKVKNIMRKNPLVIKENTSIECACKMLIEENLSGMPVADENYNLTGFLSERDIIYAISRGKSLKAFAKDIMNKKVFFVHEDSSVEEISKVFMEKPYKLIPVIKNKKVAGIVSRKDVLDKLLGNYY